MPEPTLCTFSGGCDRRMYARKLCSTHYEQQRAGKPLTPIGTYQRQPQQCTQCGRKPMARGLCTGHYAQQMRGEPFTPLGTRRRGRPSANRDETKCIVETCTNTRQEDLFCPDHWALISPRITSDRTGRCRVIECESKPHSHGFCQTHWGRVTRYGRISRIYAENTEGTCKAGDGTCRELVHAKGYCLTHYRRIQRTGDPGPARLIPQAERMISKYAGETCKAELDGQRCPRMPKSLGWCPMHYHRWRRTGDPLGKWGLEPRKSQGYTTTDGYFMANVDGVKILEHRLVMAQIIGRPLRTFEEPHHKNGLRDDNTPGNLELWVKWRQPNGQRLTDLIEFVVTYYPGEVMAALAARMTESPVT